jgi:hypothetical protein
MAVSHSPGMAGYRALFGSTTITCWLARLASAVLEGDGAVLPSTVTS